MFSLHCYQSLQHIVHFKCLTKCRLRRGYIISMISLLLKAQLKFFHNFKTLFLCLSFCSPVSLIISLLQFISSCLKFYCHQWTIFFETLCISQWLQPEIQTCLPQLFAFEPRWCIFKLFLNIKSFLLFYLLKIPFFSVTYSLQNNHRVFYFFGALSFPKRIHMPIYPHNKHMRQLGIIILI